MFGAMETRFYISPNQQEYAWEGIGFNPTSQVSQGFSTYSKKVNFDLSAKKDNFPNLLKKNTQITIKYINS